MIEHYDEFIIRFMPAKDEVAGSVTIPTEVTPGTKVWMTRRDPDKMYSGAESLGERIVSRANGRKPALVMQFDCAGRGKTMFRQDQKSRLISRLQEVISPDAPWIGFFTYGEIGPVDEMNYFHNYTAVIASVY
jgi:small ligand-binding sensory domain FIST